MEPTVDSLGQTGKRSDTMPRILLTAFEPYDRWSENSSWQTLVELTRWRDFGGQVVTRRYPVDWGRMRERLRTDLAADYDYAIHLGQAPGATHIRLEAVGLNMDSEGELLASDGPDAYRCHLPLPSWSRLLQARGIPTIVSYHAGTYLCNALLYLSQHIAKSEGYRTQSAFIHLPLVPSQVSSHPELASMSLPMLTAGISAVIEELCGSDTQFAST
jgi:pyroglutamyl-peptidase